MAGQWYCYLARQRYGPLPFEQLQQWAAEGHLRPDDRVCASGQREWIPARNVPGLFGPVAAPLPIPTAEPELEAPPISAPVVTPGIQINTGTRAYSGGSAVGRAPKKADAFKWGSGLMAGLITALIGGNRLMQLQHNRVQAIEQRQAEQARREKMSRPPPPPPTTRPAFDAEAFQREALKQRNPRRP